MDRTPHQATQRMARARGLFPFVFTPDVVPQMKVLRHRVLAETADDPVAR